MLPARSLPHPRYHAHYFGALLLRAHPSPHRQASRAHRRHAHHVELQVETQPDFPIDEIRKIESLKKRLSAELKSNLQIAVDVKIVEPKTIARSEGKAKRVIDLREGKN